MQVLKCTVRLRKMSAKHWFAMLEPVQAEYARIRNDREYLNSVMRDGAEKASARAANAEKGIRSGWFRCASILISCCTDNRFQYQKASICWPLLSDVLGLLFSSGNSGGFENVLLAVGSLVPFSLCRGSISHRQFWRCEPICPIEGPVGIAAGLWSAINAAPLSPCLPNTVHLT